MPMLSYTTDSGKLEVTVTSYSTRAQIPCKLQCLLKFQSVNEISKCTYTSYSIINSQREPYLQPKRANNQSVVLSSTI